MNNVICVYFSLVELDIQIDLEGYVGKLCKCRLCRQIAIAFASSEEVLLKKLSKEMSVGKRVSWERKTLLQISEWGMRSEP
jgi:hypothetical protein